MRRRDFFTLLTSAVALSPLAGHTEQAVRRRRIGVLMALPEDHPEAKVWLAAFRLGLERRGWTEGRNLHVDYRFTGARTERIAELTRELLVLQPEVILAHTTAVAAAFKRETRTVPIVFVHVSDPIAATLVPSLARPDGNLTGVLHYEAGIVGKWVAMLKEISPGLARVALLANSKTTAYDYFLRSAQAAAPLLGVDVVPARIETPTEIEQAIESFARQPGSGLVLPPDATTILHRDLIVARASEFQIPAVYALRAFVAAGGLMSYGTDQDSLFRLAAAYVDRLLRGDKASELPVQAPTRYEMAINLKTARALGLSLPPALLVAADEVIE